MPFFSSMRLGCWGLNSCSLGMGIFSQGLLCWAGRAMGAIAAATRYANDDALEKDSSCAGSSLRASIFLSRLLLCRRLRYRSMLWCGCGHEDLVGHAADVGLGHLVHPVQLQE